LQLITPIKMSKELLHQNGDLILDKKYDKKFVFDEMQHGAVLKKLPARFENLDLPSRAEKSPKAKKAKVEEKKDDAPKTEEKAE